MKFLDRFKHKIEFADISEMERLQACVRMKDEKITKYLKSRYTNNLIAAANTNGEMSDRLRGRMEENRDILDQIEQSEEALLKIEQHLEKQKFKGSTLDNLKNKLLNINHEISKKQRSTDQSNNL